MGVNSNGDKVTPQSISPLHSLLPDSLVPPRPESGMRMRLAGQTTYFTTYYWLEGAQGLKDMEELDQH